MTGVAPVYESNGRVFLQTWVNYEDARREALATGRDLVVLVDVSDAVRRQVAHEVGGSAIVCSTTPSESYKFAGPGVYRYAFDGRSGGLWGGPVSAAGAARAIARQRTNCVNGRCYPGR